MNNVYIKGRAITCSLGQNLDDIILSIEQGTIAMDELTMNFGGDELQRPYFRIRRQNERYRDLRSEEYFYDVLYDTVSRALDDAGISSSAREDMAVFFGSTSIDIPLYEDAYLHSDPSLSNIFSQDSPGYGRVVSMAARRFGIHGPCYTFTTACTSTANAMLYASAMIKEGMVSRALVIGYDLYNDLGFLGFESLMLIARGPYMPFDRNRNGIVMGEACGAVVLEGIRREDGCFKILGGANICDTSNVTTHNVDGSIIARVIERGLDNAGLDKHDIDVIKAHATGTVYNDKTEVMGMRLVYGTDLPPVTGIKPYIGHTVGAAGATELIIMAEAAKRGFVPASPGFQEPDPELDVVPLTEHIPFSEGNIMLNYFGFGGNCTSMIISNRE